MKTLYGLLFTFLILLLAYPAYSFEQADLFSGGPDQSVYVIINGLVVGDKMKDLLDKHEHMSLFHGRPEAQFGSMSPFIFPLEINSPLMLWLDEHPCVKRQSLFLTGRGSLYDITEQLQKLIIVKAWSTKHREWRDLYLRFYDPTVMKTMFQVLDNRQLMNLFGPVDAYYVHTPIYGTYRRYFRVASQVSSNLLKTEFSPRCIDVPGDTKEKLIKRYSQLWTFHKAHIRMVPFTAICCGKNDERITRQIPVLKISRKQYSLFASFQLRKFHYRAYWQLKKEPLADELSHRELINIVETGTEKSQAGGMRSEDQIISYIKAMLVFGTDFDRDREWARLLLGSDDLTANRKKTYLDLAVRMQNSLWLDLDSLIEGVLHP
jgi:hypothetical protein